MLGAAYFDGRSSRRHEVVLALSDGRLIVEGSFGRRSEALEALSISEPMGEAPRIIRFADGAFCEVADLARLAALLTTAGVADSPLVTLQRRWRWALAALIGVVATIVATYVWGLPWLADTLAPRIPAAFVTTISETALESLDAHLLAPSKLPPERQRAIAARLAQLDARFGPLPPHRLNFRSAPRLGANAFALPNGDLVLFDELVALADNDDDVTAVLAHELGHVVYRHGMRQMIQGAVVSFVVGAWFGDVSSIATGLGALVLESRYSRTFESEADAYAGRILIAANGTAEPLAKMLGRLEDSHAAKHGGNKNGGGLSEAFQSHPDTAARIAAIRALSAN